MAKDERRIYGYVEKATIVDKKRVSLSAKLDTGAKSASLSATQITLIEVKGVPYLRFIVPTKSGDYPLEAEYIGRVQIKARSHELPSASASSTVSINYIKRPVVRLNIELGDKVRSVRVNLTNRKHFLYPLLLGRDAIIDFNGAVDPALIFTTNSKGAKYSNGIKHAKNTESAKGMNSHEKQ